MSIIRRQIQKEALNLSQARKIILAELILISIIINNLVFHLRRQMIRAIQKELVLIKEQKSWRQKSQWGFPSLGMIYSFHVTKISWLRRRHGLLELEHLSVRRLDHLGVRWLELQVHPGSILIYGEGLILYIIFIILIQYLSKDPGFWGLSMRG